MGARIKSARLAKGLSLRALSERVGVSHQAIHKYETNRDVPSSGVLISLSMALGVKPEFFFRGERHLSIMPTFRKHPRLSARAEASVMSAIKEWLERYLDLEDLMPFVSPVEFPPPFEPLRVTSMDDVELLVERLRDAWELGDGPVAGLMEFLEDKGVKVGILDLADEAFDACGFWVEGGVGMNAPGREQRTSALGVPAIAMRAGVPGDRQRFSLAHELGHLLMQYLGHERPEAMGSTAGRPAAAGVVDVEKAANRFAGAFLVPRKAGYLELGEHRRNISLDELELLKLKYGLSMQAWLRRALELGIISEELEARLFRELKAQGAPKVEPGEAVPPEKPGRLRRMALRAVAEGLMTGSRASELMGAPLRDV